MAVKDTFRTLGNGASSIAGFIFNLPGNIVWGLGFLVLGGTINRPKRFWNDETPYHFAGLVGFVAALAVYTAHLANKTAKAVSNFVSRHSTAISAAFWAAGAAIGLTVLSALFWPAGLAAVVGFSIGGFSIATLVGTGLVAQAGVLAGLAAAATLVVAGVVNFVSDAFSALRALSTAKTTNETPTNASGTLDQDFIEIDFCPKKMAPVGRVVRENQSSNEVVPPSTQISSTVHAASSTLPASSTTTSDLSTTDGELDDILDSTTSLRN